MRIVVKFGGTSIGDGGRIRRAADIVRSFLDGGNEVVVVISALNGVTDYILEVSDEAVSDGGRPAIGAVKDLAGRHIEAAKGALPAGKPLNQVIKKVDGLIEEFRRVLESVITLKELTPRTRDYLLSFGEKLSTTIFGAALRVVGVKCESLTGGEAGIITDDFFGRAVPLMKVTAYRVKERLSQLLEGDVTPVVAGYIAHTQDGVTTTLGRGGSDYTATIIGYALDTDEVRMYTDVDGLMTADPDIVSAARVIKSISYSEAMELVYFGAKAMHPRALEPAMEKGIPILIKNTFNPGEEGTLIHDVNERVSKEVVRAVTVIWDVALITVTGAGMIGTPGVAAKVFGVLGKKRINILMISQSSSEANISLLLRRRDLNRAVDLLELNLLGKGLIREVLSEEDVCAIAVVGAGMRGSVGVAARIFKAVAARGVNVRAIAQGSSELNVSFIVSNSDGLKAVRALHSEFDLGGS